MATQNKLPRSRALAAKLIYAALSILRDNGKEMPMRELLKKVEQKTQLDDWDRERYEKSGYIRWESILHFFSRNGTLSTGFTYSLSNKCPGSG
jgi:restriction system protein